MRILTIDQLKEEAEKKLAFRVETEEQHKLLVEGGIRILHWTNNAVYDNRGCYWASTNEETILYSYKQWELIKINWEKVPIYEIY